MMNLMIIRIIIIIILYESTLRSDAKIYDNENESKIINIKLIKKNKNRNNQYNYCGLDEIIVLNEMDLLEIYDFVDEKALIMS